MKKHTKQSLQKEVIGYDNLTTFRKDKLNIYKQICRKGLKDELLGQLTKVSWKKISDSDLIARGKQFTTLTKMTKEDSSVYVMLRTRGLLDEVFKDRGGSPINFSEFLIRADTVNHKYSNYTGYQKTVDVINLKCGHSYTQSPKNHLAGAGCAECAGTKRLTNKIFTQKANKIHNFKYDYSKINYINTKTHITIVCHKHGDFKQTPMDHLSGCGCDGCNIGSSDADTFYIWEVIDMKWNNKPVFKFGITSDRLGMRRIIRVAGKHNVKYKLHLKITNKNAGDIEKLILNKFNDIPEMIGDGATEFRAVEYKEIERIKSLYTEI